MRKLLVIRGARQVGKTWLVRDLPERHNLKLVELNLERFPNLADLFSENDPSQKMALTKRSFTMLSQAKICSKILHTSGNGLPLGAESNEKIFKALMLDIGLTSVQLGLYSLKFTDAKDIIFSKKGGLTEQFVGQQLRSAQTPSTDPQLYYWQRNGGRLGEIDYIIQLLMIEQGWIR
jgi:predicted AAA+ superfamily ATPase